MHFHKIILALLPCICNCGACWRQPYSLCREVSYVDTIESNKNPLTLQQITRPCCNLVNIRPRLRYYSLAVKDTSPFHYTFEILDTDSLAYTSSTICFHYHIL
jgi:hypothetical protein